jgi:hypothetical protein
MWTYTYSGIIKILKPQIHKQQQQIHFTGFSRQPGQSGGATPKAEERVCPLPPDKIEKHRRPKQQSPTTPFWYRYHERPKRQSPLAGVSSTG